MARGVAVLAFVSGVAGSQVTPVQKVLDMMQGMLAKAKEGKHGEQVQFASFKQFCDDTALEKTRRISEANEKIDRLNADIEKYTSDAAMLAKEISEHEEDISVWTGDIKAATRVREIEKADYIATHKDYSESVDALGRAIGVLKGQRGDHSQASLLQLTDMSLIPEQARNQIESFLARDLQEPDLSEPEAIGYEFQSHGIIEMLEKLETKFLAERTDLENKERNSQQDFEVLLQDLNAEIAEATAQRDRKTKLRAQKLESKATAESDVSETTATRDADQKYLDDLNATCHQKTSDFNDRQKLRAEEIDAIAKAIEIIGSDSVAGSADKHLPALVQTAAKTALAQFAVESQGLVKAKAKATMYLETQAKLLNSRLLSNLVERAAADPFVKVKKMVKDLIARLMEEASQESDHKAWCDSELSTNEQVRKEKTENVEVLHAQIDELKATIATLNDELSDLAQGIANLDAAMAEATKIREDETAKNAQTVEDSKAAQTAVAQALVVLKEFYAKAGQATAFAQQQSQVNQPVPEIFDSSYKGMQTEAGGVVGMLEVIETDFQRLQAETEASEETAQKEYDGFMADSKADKAAKEKDIETKNYKKQDEEQALTVASDDLESYQSELDAALVYFDKLKPSCVEVGVSYDDRVARREEEIQSLKQAVEILEQKAE